MTAEPTRLSSQATGAVFHIGYPRTGTTWLKWTVLPRFAAELDAAGVEVVCYEGFSGSALRDDLEIAERLGRTDPASRIILTLRSQTDLIPSLYWQYVKGGGRLRYPDYARAVIDNGKFRYADMLKVVYAEYEAQDVFVAVFEDLQADAAGFLTALFGFLGVDAEIDFADIDMERYRNVRPSDFFVEGTRQANRLVGVPDINDEGRELVIRTLIEGWPTDVVAPHRRRLRRRRPIQLGLIVAQRAWREVTGQRPERKPYPRIQRMIMEAYAINNRAVMRDFGIDLAGRGYPGVD